MNELIQVNGGLQVLVDLVTNGKSTNTKRAYGRAINDYAEFVQAASFNAKMSMGGFTRSMVMFYVNHLQNEGYSPASINQRLAALRSLARELRYTGALKDDIARGIGEIENVPDRGSHVGHWLTQDEARDLLDAPERDTLQGRQERLLLALLLGVGLRRSEAADLDWAHIKEHGGNFFVTNIVGKHNRKRTIPIPPWVVKILLDWKDETAAAGLILRAVSKSDKLAGHVRTQGGGMTNGGLSAQAVYKKVKLLAARAHITDLGPHSLRRTYAQRLYKQGCPLDQISLFLGHKNLETTELYLGLKNVDLEDPFFVEY